MGFTFQIRPVTIEKGFVLSCEGILREERIHRRLVDAVVDAIMLGRELEAELQIFDADGKVAEIFQLRPSRSSGRSAGQAFTSRGALIETN
jgi:hypothetical protein